MPNTALIVLSVAAMALLVIVIILNAVMFRDRERLVERLRRDRTVLSDAVETARRVFERYASVHDAKDTPEGRDKAARNRRLAETMALGLQMANAEHDQ